jgi:hypothetical protein
MTDRPLPDPPARKRENELPDTKRDGQGPVDLYLEPKRRRRIGVDQKTAAGIEGIHVHHQADSHLASATDERAIQATLWQVQASQVRKIERFTAR